MPASTRSSERLGGAAVGAVVGELEQEEVDRPVSVVGGGHSDDPPLGSGAPIRMPRSVSAAPHPGGVTPAGDLPRERPGGHPPEMRRPAGAADWVLGRAHVLASHLRVRHGRARHVATPEDRSADAAAERARRGVVPTALPALASS